MPKDEKDPKKGKSAAKKTARKTPKKSTETPMSAPDPESTESTTTESTTSTRPNIKAFEDRQGTEHVTEPLKFVLWFLSAFLGALKRGFGEEEIVSIDKLPEEIDLWGYILAYCENGTRIIRKFEQTITAKPGELLNKANPKSVEYALCTVLAIFVGIVAAIHLLAHLPGWFSFLILIGLGFWSYRLAKLVADHFSSDIVDYLVLFCVIGTLATASTLIPWSFIDNIVAAAAIGISVYIALHALPQGFEKSKSEEEPEA